MSWLDATLKQLQQKKLKVDYLKYLKEKLIDIKNIDFTEVEKEVKDDVLAFIDSHVAMIESNEISKKEEISNIFTSEEFSALKLLVSKALRKQSMPTNDPMSPPVDPKPKPKQVPERKQDKIQFALANRHLDGKEVVCRTPNGEVTGKVVGLDAPYVIVKTDTGHTAPVLLENIIL